MKSFTLLAVIAMAIVLAGCPGGPVIESEAFSVASFNLETYGATKAGNAEINSVMAQIIRGYDIVAVQEITDVTESHIDTLLTAVNSDGSTYGLITSERLGRTASKEQYGLFYNTTVVEFSGDSYTYDDVGDLFEREPYSAKFMIKGKDLDFIVTNIHIKPNDAVAEIALLDDAMDAMSTFFAESDIVCLGTLNADGVYYDEADLSTDFPIGSYLHAIGDMIDTTVVGLGYTYDRIIATTTLSMAEPGRAGAYQFDTEIDFTPFAIVPGDVSDHLPVFAELVVQTD